MGFYEADGCYTEIRNTYETTNVGPDYWGSSHHLQLRDFYDSILYDRPVTIDAMEGRKTLEMVKGIYLSSLEPETDLIFRLKMCVIKIVIHQNKYHRQAGLNYRGFYIPGSII